MMPGTTTATDRNEERVEARRQLAAALNVVTAYAMLTVPQRRAVRDALNAADWQIVTQHAEVKRLEREAERLGRVAPDLSDYIDAAHGLICNAHRTTVDHVTEADGASPGWAEAARRWIDAYPPNLTAGHDEFAAEVARIREHDELFAANKRLERERDQHLAERDRALAEARALIDERDQARALVTGDEARAALEKFEAQRIREVQKGAIEREHLREELAQRDQELRKRWKRNRELNGDVAVAQDARAKAEHERDRLRARNEEIEGDRVALVQERDRLRATVTQMSDDRLELLKSRDSMRAERDKAVHQLRRAEDRLAAIRLTLDPGWPDNTEPGPRPGPTPAWPAPYTPGWNPLDTLRARTERLAATPGRTVRVTPDQPPIHVDEHRTRVRYDEDQVADDYDPPEQPPPLAPGPPQTAPKLADGWKHVGWTSDSPVRTEVVGVTDHGSTIRITAGPPDEPEPRPTSAELFRLARSAFRLQHVPGYDDDTDDLEDLDLIAVLGED